MKQCIGKDINHRGRMNKTDKLAHIEARCESTERDIQSLQKNVKSDIAACMSDIKNLRSELENINKFMDANCLELKDLTFDLICLYKKCDEITSGLKRLFHRLSSRMITGLAVCEQNVELIREMSQNGGILDQEKYAKAWQSDVGYESPIVDTTKWRGVDEEETE